MADSTAPNTEGPLKSVTATAADTASKVTSTVTDTASSAATAVAGAATTAKDNVFSMFGGGPKKETKKDEDDVDEPSGSSKAKKDAEEVRASGADHKDVGLWISFY